MLIVLNVGIAHSRTACKELTPKSFYDPSLTGGKTINDSNIRIAVTLKIKEIFLNGFFTNIISIFHLRLWQNTHCGFKNQGFACGRPENLQCSVTLLR